LPTVRFGRAVRVSVNTLQKWVAEREQRSIPESLQYNAQRSNIMKERIVA